MLVAGLKSCFSHSLRRARNRTSPTRADRRTRACGVSLVLHACLLALLAWLTLPLPEDENSLVLATKLPKDDPLVRLEPVHFADWPEESLGARNAVVPEAPDWSTEVRLPTPLATDKTASIDAGNNMVHMPRAPQLNMQLVVHGAAGIGVSGAVGAVDRITHEILLSLEERPTLVAWLFDQSASLASQRETIHRRFQTIYEELGLIEAQRNPAFARHRDKPLLTSVIAFGERFTYRTPQPTDNLEEIMEAVEGIEIDPSGRERVFSTICDAVKRLRSYRAQSPRRNMLIVVFTDEVGDDVDVMDDAVNLCRNASIPVYVVGVPAPFGRRQAFVRYVDPNPQFDQTPLWLPVDQGPESLLPERLKLHMIGTGRKDQLLDSGFGPYGLSRLCVETGGILFAVRPGGEAGGNQAGGSGSVDGGDRGVQFAEAFDPQVMRRYQPDYVSLREYEDFLRRNRACAALVEAAAMSWVAPLEDVRTHFPRVTDEELVGLLSDSQQAAAQLEPKLDRIDQILRRGLEDRPQITEPRWQAGFDLAYGRILAAKVRTESYNLMLARAKQGMAFRDSASDTWILQPADDAPPASRLAQRAQQAQRLLQQVVDEHPGTPWSWIAERELAQPLGWRWNEARLGVKPRDESAQARPATPQDEMPLRIAKPKPKRPPPAL
jgi:hypothetical protein